MGKLLAVVLLIILIVFGCSSMMDSYADARQAQATIEVAQVAQTQAWTNLISVLVLSVLILLIVFGLVALLFLAIRFRQARAETMPVKLSLSRRAALPAEPRQLGAPTEFDDITPEEIELVRRILDV
jgi:heme/copper-type cytochrome/quinol oxidase subunit 2